MEGLLQTASSQSKSLDKSINSNNTLNNNGGDKLKRPKPPLLPKPKGLKLDTNLQKTLNKIQVSQRISSEKDCTFLRKNEFTTDNDDVIQSSVDSIVQNVEKFGEKPNLSPKPQLPPKFKPFKPDNSLAKPQNVPQFDATSSKSPSVDTTPIRPPRSPQKNIKSNQLEQYTIKQGLLDSSELPKSLILSKQKSASLSRNENLNWTIKELVQDTDQLNEFCKQVEQCSKHSHILRREFHSPVAPARSKKKSLCEVDTSSSSCSTNNDIFNDNIDASRNFISNGEDSICNDTSDSVISSVNEELKDFFIRNQGNLRSGLNLIGNSNVSIRNKPNEKNEINEINSTTIQPKVQLLVDSEDGASHVPKLCSPKLSSGETEIHSENQKVENSKSEQPDSFLYRHINTLKATKEYKTGEEEEVITDKNQNVQTFLHRNKNQPSLNSNENKLTGEVEPETLAIDISTKNEKTVKKNSPEKEEPFELSETKKPVNSPVLNSLCLDNTPFGKRFPWFNSFGKGSKKDAPKKARCQSQFYPTSSDTEEKLVLRNKNRTKSLPNIKQTRAHTDYSTTMNPSESSEKIEIQRISNEYPHSDSDDDKDSLNQVESGYEKDSKTMAYLKAKELMTSEEVFIDVLKLLNVDFRNHVQFRDFESKNTCIPCGEVNKILNHLSQLQSLNEDILEDLKKRIDNWENNPKIADVIVKKGAFLKMYTTYIQNFESQTNYLDECVVKYPKFGKIVKEFEATDRCKKLSLKHYMLKPVQRIPQYRLLLNDYLKYLDESSADYADTLNALKIVCEVVDHANRNVAYGDKEGRLMHFQSLLSDYELVRPGRELIKYGPLEKICRKAVRDRYFILLNDCLLHTTYSKQYLKIHQDLPLSGMKICPNDDPKYPTSFTVHSITKSFILCAKNEAECKEWVETLQKTIEDHIRRQKTFYNAKIEVDSSFKLGKEAPVWVQDSKVTMCQICTAEFTALFRRHHCRGCGKVVCRNCGGNQAPLQYRNFKPDRVCDQCFDLLLKEYEESEDSICELLKEMFNLNIDLIQNEYLSIKAKFIKYTSGSNWKKQKYIPPRLKEVSANDSESVISGWLYRKSRKSWKQFWYVLKDHVLYIYKASEDVLALETMPVLGYNVEMASANIEDIDKKLIFALVHPRQTPIIFRAETPESAVRWFEALSSATNLDYLTI